jgi:hypothetical protein
VAQVGVGSAMFEFRGVGHGEGHTVPWLRCRPQDPVRAALSRAAWSPLNTPLSVP